MSHVWLPICFNEGVLEMKKILLFGLVSLMGIGCAKHKPVVKIERKPLTNFESAMIIASNSASAARSMQARVNNAVASNLITKGQSKQSLWQANHKIKGLQKKISLDWVGGVDGFIRAIKLHLHGWKVVTIGKAPVTVPMISVFKEDSTIQEILEDVGNQLGEQVDIIVSSNKKVHQIKFVYLDERYDS